LCVNDLAGVVENNPVSRVHLCAPQFGEGVGDDRLLEVVRPVGPDGFGTAVEDTKTRVRVGPGVNKALLGAGNQPPEVTDEFLPEEFGDVIQRLNARLLDRNTVVLRGDDGLTPGRVHVIGGGPCGDFGFGGRGGRRNDELLGDLAGNNLFRPRHRWPREEFVNPHDIPVVVVALRLALRRQDVFRKRRLVRVRGILGQPLEFPRPHGKGFRDCGKRRALLDQFQLSQEVFGWTQLNRVVAEVYRHVGIRFG
jgi:hypothetical protein